MSDQEPMRREGVRAELHKIDYLTHQKSGLEQPGSDEPTTSSTCADATTPQAFDITDLRFPAKLSVSTHRDMEGDKAVGCPEAHSTTVTIKIGGESRKMSSPNTIRKTQQSLRYTFRDIKAPERHASWNG